MKKVLLFWFIFFVVLFFGWDLYVENDKVKNGLEIFFIPSFCRRDVVELSDEKSDLFSDEKIEKVYLSKIEANAILKQIKRNNNWKYGDIEESIENALKSHTEEDIYNKIPYVENKYWIFTNMGHGFSDIHNINGVDGFYYYAVTFGLFDIDNNVLYYYEYYKS